MTYEVSIQCYCVLVGGARCDFPPLDRRAAYKVRGLLRGQGIDARIEPSSITIDLDTIEFIMPEGGAEDFDGALA